ncbi:MAG: peptidylprolyl isomerase [Desulfuromonas thiophila]|nr:peptidylprolyl isomerase [Desulfuromonas thiophila]
MPEKTIVVNNRPISHFDFINAVQSYAMELHRKTADQLDADEREQIQELAVERLIARELIFQQALAQGQIADDTAVQQQIDSIRANFPSEEEFYATLAKAGIDRMAYFRMIRQDLTVNQATDAKLAEAAPPDEAQIAAFYQAHPEKMRKSPMVRASHILIRTTPETASEAQQQIAALRQQALDGASFADLAREHSACPSAAQGGDLGLFGKGKMVKSFEEAAFALKPGEISPVVETPFGLHLIRVTDAEEPRHLELEEVRDQIAAYLKEQNGARLLQDWVEQLRQNASIRIDG